MINSLTSVTLVDFIQRLRPNASLSEASQLRLARVLSFAYGLLVMVLAFLVPYVSQTLLEASNSIIGLVGGPLLGLFALGIFVPRATARGAFWGWLIGFALLIPVCFASTVSFLWYALIGCVVTTGVGYLVSRLEPPPPRVQVDGLTWFTRESGEPAPVAESHV
ncbi:MAG: hypothetical protein U0794_21295 [Isosphaeraceae bacterium]